MFKKNEKKTKNDIYYNKLLKTGFMYTILSLLIIGSINVYYISSGKSKIIEKLIYTYINAKNLSIENNYYEVTAEEKVICTTIPKINLRLKTTCETKNISFSGYINGESKEFIKIEDIVVSLETNIFTRTIKDLLKEDFKVDLHIGKVYSGDNIFNQFLKNIKNDKKLVELIKVFSKDMYIDMTADFKGNKNNEILLNINSTTGNEIIEYKFNLLTLIKVYDKIKEYTFEEVLVDNNDTNQNIDQNIDQKAIVKTAYDYYILENYQQIQFKNRKVISDTFYEYYIYTTSMYDSIENVNKSYFNITKKDLLTERDFNEEVIKILSLSNKNIFQTDKEQYFYFIKSFFEGSNSACHKIKVRSMNNLISGITTGYMNGFNKEEYRKKEKEIYKRIINNSQNEVTECR